MPSIRRSPFLRRAAATLLACSALALGTWDLRPDGRATIARARAEDGWLSEFEAVCSRTQDAMTLTDDELRGLIVRCDALRPKIATLDESRRKVYSKRLQLCRDLYDFVLKSRGGS